ncbi:SPFH domain-containing protein [Acidisphaera sp. L21]|uniref:SPFH domain-containing protein n=1 Tax=Acidisphaera sp. L21 TaxID=1641851 RepID=UPI00131E4616|nr:SPFH domain-containing protein [Acidisphaera sp. L21]
MPYYFIAPAIVVILLLIRSIRMVREWDRAVVLRLGRFHAIKGPGLVLVIPLLDQVAVTVDMRVETTTITAEQALTRDTVAVGVDAIVFWQVSDARAAAINIANYRQAIERVSQTSLREMIGSTDLAQLLSDRKAADEKLRVTIGDKTGSWGVAIRSVEIKDVAIPPGLQNAMSMQAQAERERQARVTLASAEEAIAEQVMRAASIYAQNPVALQLRQMNLLYEMNKDRGSTVLIPTDMASALGAAFKPPPAA